MLEEATQDAEDSQLMDALARLAEEPLDLNSATAEELQQIPEITPMMALNVVTFRQGRPFRSVDEILIVEGFMPEILPRIRPYLKVVPVKEVVTLGGLPSGSVRSRSMQDLQRRRGFVEGAYAGTPLKLYNRAILRSRNLELLSSPLSIELGLLAEKDAGERRLDDFTAGYLEVRIPDMRSRVVVGDYVMEVAEGMVLWRGIGFSKGSSVLAGARKGGIGLRPYISTDENLFFRGVAAEVNMDWVLATVFYSNKPMNASVSADGVVTSFYSSGDFRTASEERRRGATNERLFGARMLFKPTRSLSFGATGYTASFKHPVVLGEGRKRFGKATTTAGLDFSYVQRRSTIFSEIAQDERGTIGGVGGILYQPGSSLAMSLVVRSYPRNFLSLHGYGFGESGGPPENESGVYLAVRSRIASWWLLSAYYDQFIFPRHSSSVLLSSSGYDVLTLSEFRLTRRTMVEFQFKQKKKGATFTALDALGRTMVKLGEQTQENYRMTLHHTASVAFRWKSRVEIVQVALPGGRGREKGVLLFQDVRMYPISLLLLNARVIMFDTDSFQSRVYEFETDLPGTFSNPALFGKGIRWYVVARYEVAQWFDISIKYAQTLKDRTKTMSSGLNEIVGNLDNRLSLQIDFIF